MARRSKFTEETQQRILNAVALGATYELAAGYGGVTYETLRTWMNTKPVFSAAVASAASQGAIRCLAKIQEAARDGDWRSAAWLLEHRWPQQYGRTVQEQTGQQVLRVVYDHDWRRTAAGAVMASPGVVIPLPARNAGGEDE